MSDNNSLLIDIKSGKGLPPIKSQPDKNPPPKGLISENRGQDANGLRIDRFSVNTVDRNKGEK